MSAGAHDVRESVRAKCSNLCADHPQKNFKSFPHKVDHYKVVNAKFWAISPNRSVAMNFLTLGLFVLFRRGKVGGGRGKNMKRL